MSVVGPELSRTQARILSIVRECGPISDNGIYVLLIDRYWPWVPFRDDVWRQRIQLTERGLLKPNKAHNQLWETA